MQSRFKELDGLRGIAAFAVLISHFTGAYNTRYVGDPRPLFDFPYGAFGVQLFFLISGFVILMTALRARVPSDFVISRVSRIYPAYWLSLIAALVVGRLWQTSEVQLSLWESILNFTMFQRWLFVPNAVDVYWTLAVELQFYIVIFVLLVVTRCRLSAKWLSSMVWGWLAISLVVAIWAGPYSRGIDPQNVVTPVKVVLNLTLAEFGPLFCAGMLAYVARGKKQVTVQLIIASASAVAVAVLLHNWLYGGIVAGICIFFVYVAMRETTRWLTIAPLQFLGRISYSLYIIHAVVGYMIIKVAMPYIGRDWGMLMATVGSILAAWLLYEIGEKRGSALMKRALEFARERFRSWARAQSFNSR